MEKVSKIIVVCVVALLLVGAGWNNVFNGIIFELANLSGDMRLATWDEDNDIRGTIKIDTLTDYMSTNIDTLSVEALAVGHETPTTAIDVMAEGNDSREATISTFLYSNSPSITDASYVTAGRARGTMASPDYLDSLDNIGIIAGTTYNGSDAPDIVCALRALATEDHDATSQGTAIQIWYTPNGATVPRVIETFDENYGECESYKAHRLREQDGSVANAWTDCSAFQEIEAESCEGIVNLVDSVSFVILKAGLYQFGGCVHVQNNTGVGFDDILILTRLTQNGTEMKCSQRGYAGEVRSGGEDVLSYNGTSTLAVGDTVKLQYYTNNTNLDFDSNINFEEQVAYTLWLNYIGKK